MHLFVVLTMFSLIVNLITSQTTRETTSPKDVLQTLATMGKDGSSQHPDGSSPQLNSLWVYRPASQQQSAPPADLAVRGVARKPVQSLTRLAKTLTFGFDPYFSKGYFEPFERRPKPVTLVAFRKNGLLPRTRTTMDSKSAEIAELQSPYNDISNFWVDD